MAAVAESQADKLVVAFAGGGTGGHLYPALAVADAIRRIHPRARFVFFGTRRSVDAHVLGDADCDAVLQTLTPLSRYPWRWPGVYFSLRRAIADCRERFSVQRPSIVVGTGGLASVPAVLAARRAGIPTAILNPDAVPGRANRFLAGRVDAVLAQWSDTENHLPRSASLDVLGCPVRPQVVSATRSAGIARFNLDPERRTLLVTGASQGARTVNDAILANAPLLVRMQHWQTLHLTGEREFERISAAYESAGLRGCVVGYTDHMGEALAAADLVVSRAGASTLAELTAVGRASILMPYPYDRAQHQKANALCLSRAGAAQIVPDAKTTERNGPALAQALERLMTDDQGREAMAKAAGDMGRPGAAAAIADRILVLAGCDGSAGSCESVEGVS